jgi:hypothetical protein
MKWYLWIVALLLGITVCGATEKVDMKHATKLPDGTIIELIAIRPYGGGDPRRTREKPGPWWRPNGVLLNACPDKRNWSCSWNDSYLIVVAIENDDDVSCRAVGPWDNDLMVEPIKEKGQGFEKRDIRRFTLRFGDQKSSDIRLCVATGQWKTLEHWSINKWSTPYDHFFVSSEQVIMRCPEQKDSDVVAEVTQVITESATRLVAFDHDGNLYQSTVTQGGKSAGLVRFIHRFKNLDRNSIDHLEFQVRPYDYWITFRNVSLQPGQKTQVKVDLKKPGTLLPGEALPDFDGIEINLTTDQTDGKMLLVCFFDMQQRPSRYCIMQLAKQVEQLKQRGIITVAVQASKIEQNTLNKWVKENNIPFPVGMIEGDEEKIHFSWGVKSLPWLILTDAKHIVHAEGLSINELNAELSKEKKT